MKTADRFERSLETIAQTEGVIEGMELTIEASKKLLARSRELLRKISEELKR